MPGFGFSVGDVIAVIELIRKSLSGLKATTGAAAKYQRTILELENLSRVLHHAERLTADELHPDASRVDSIRAAAFATSLVLRDFLSKFQQYEATLAANSQSKKARRAASAIKYTFVIDEEVDKFHYFLSGQLLSITTFLQLLERDLSHKRELRRNEQHQELLGALSSQTAAIHDLSRTLVPPASNAVRNHQLVESLARTARTQTKMLLNLQKSIAERPLAQSGDCINVLDVLGRSFQLPFSFFSHWTMIESFIKDKFADTDIPGRMQIQKGDFFLSRIQSERRPITRSTWASEVYPGMTVNMTVVFSMLKMSAEYCPRPSCSTKSWVPTHTASFRTCPICGLQFRHDPTVKLPDLPAEDERIQATQTSEDADLFGLRQSPVDISGMSAEPRETLPLKPLEYDLPRKQSLASGPQALSVQNLTRLNGYSDGRPSVTSGEPTEARSLHLAKEVSGLFAVSEWLDSSAIPSTSPTAHFTEDPLQSRNDRLHQEYKDLESLRRVHFLDRESATMPLRDKVKEYQNMPLYQQLHVRLIVDRFPSLPAYLAKRFAISNVARTNRLRQVASRRRLANLTERTLGKDLPQGDLYESQTADDSLKRKHEARNTDNLTSAKHLYNYAGVAREM